MVPVIVCASCTLADPMRIALVTSSELPHADHDLVPLAHACEALGISTETCCWEDTAIDWGSFDIALIRSTWNYVARMTEFERWLACVDTRTRLLNPLPAIRWNMHKKYLLEIHRAGIPVVPTELVERGNHCDWNSAFARAPELVLKPAISAGSFGTIRVAAHEQPCAQAHRQEHIERDFLVQPLLRDVLVQGERNLVFLGGQYAHTTTKRARWSGDSNGVTGRVEPTAAEHAVAGRVLAYVDSLGFGALAYARVDLANDSSGNPVLMELEIFEPSLGFEYAPLGAMQLAAWLRQQ